MPVDPTRPKTIERPKRRTKESIDLGASLSGSEVRMEELRQGSRGDEVRQLQVYLKALGKDPGDVDGVFGPATAAAVRDFQDDHEQLVVDGIVGPRTLGLLRQALEFVTPTEETDAAAPPTQLQCSDETWEQFRRVVAIVTDESKPVRYGPGRGLWHEGRFVITHGAGGVGRKSWKSALGGTYPSFHCSSWTNFILGVLARRNADYCHAGNIPGLFELCSAPNVPVFQNGVGTWRGYGDICRQFTSDGSSRHRNGVSDRRRAFDLKELWERREELPTFFVCGQSSRTGPGKWKWWHHTILFVVDHRQPGSPLYRIAADGMYQRAGGKWSSRPMVYREIDESYVEDDIEKRIYRGYTVWLPATFDRPVADLELEG
jgi:hypothetical protein